jgi:uncharacterized protein (TIGR00369 family)
MYAKRSLHLRPIQETSTGLRNHGGVLCDVADATMGMAFASTLAPDESFTTINLTINCFRPVWKGRLRSEARVTNRGKNVGYVDCEISSDAGKQIA